MSVRTVAAFGLLYVAFAGLPKIDLPALPETNAPAVDAPTMELQRAVAEVAKICRNMDGFDRLVWMSTWEEAAEVIEGDSDLMSIEFENTLGLQAWQQSVFKIAWQRLAKASGKYPGLGDAVEQAFADVVGLDVRTVDEDMLEDVADLYHALAWCGARSE